MLQDTFKYTKDYLDVLFQTGQLDIKLENILQIDLKLMIILENISMKVLILRRLRAMGLK